MAEPGPEVLCLGETMSLVSPASPVPLEEAPVFTLSAGGAESNVAIHLAALGHRVGWASRVGDDPLGRRIVATIAGAGVDTDLVEVRSDAPTGVYFKDPTPDGTRVHYYRAGSAASTMDEDFLPDDLLDGPELLHISGITPALSASCDRLIRHLLTRDRDVRITFDVNYRPADDLAVVETRLLPLVETGLPFNDPTRPASTSSEACSRDRASPRRTSS
ncbi:sugar kinase, partial [Saccharopolyspora sp. NPDC002686]|uniref:sugar kinase n=1 Tax=Saccharopolyspora sp. NPDC002686 TaxID=3154541 RepID=UPI00332890A8